jgi:arginine/lysine/ornithine decarboxylase
MTRSKSLKQQLKKLSLPRLIWKRQLKKKQLKQLQWMIHLNQPTSYKQKNHEAGSMWNYFRSQMDMKVMLDATVAKKLLTFLKDSGTVKTLKRTFARSVIDRAL